MITNLDVSFRPKFLIGEAVVAIKSLRDGLAAITEGEIGQITYSEKYGFLYALKGQLGIQLFETEIKRWA